MADVGKIPGEKGPRPADESKRKKTPDSESFREMMKVGKVRETDPDEQGKRKTQAEAEEDSAAQQGGPPLQQGLGSEASPPPFFSEDASQQPPVGGATAEPPPNLPSSPPQYTPGLPSAPEPEQSTQSQQVAPAQKSQKKKKTEELPKEAIQAPGKKEQTEKGEMKPKTEGLTPQIAKPEETKGGMKAEKKEEAAAPKLPQVAGEETTPEGDLKKKEKEVAQQIEGIDQKILPPGGWEATKKTEKKDEPAGPSLEVETQSPGTQTGAPLVQPEAAPPPLAAPFASLPPQIAQLFERMVGVMTVMNESGIKQTTISLTNPQYAKSVFYGAQITISEYATAPKAFNIELTGNQQALNLMGANVEELVAAFEAGKYNFKVNRIDLSHASPSYEVKRQEAQRVKRKKSGGG